MKHKSLDEYALLSPFERIDPRAKIAGILFFIVSVTLITHFLPLLFSLMFILSLMALSRIPPAHYLKSYSIAVPFAFFAGLSMSLTKDLNTGVLMFLRISVCVLALAVLSSTTRFFDLLKGFQKLRMPRIFVHLLLFIYRYIFVFEEEYERMKIARRARGFRGGRHLFDKTAMRTLSATAGMLLVRAYQRGIRIYDALVSRGYDGYKGDLKTLKKFHMGAKDYTFSLLLVIFPLFILFIFYDPLVNLWTLLP